MLILMFPAKWRHSFHKGDMISSAFKLTSYLQSPRRGTTKAEVITADGFEKTEG